MQIVKHTTCITAIERTGSLREIAGERLWEADKEMMEARIPMKMGKGSEKLIFYKLDQLLFNFFYWSHEEKNCYNVIRNIQGRCPDSLFLPT